ncbi:TetR/AcrR family transcriptional regulator [Actinotalea ferrariae]|uniref:TetR/AcrR family transcriptional regulator n=1 Tax=Actinotalea ferrariae TaxID=1386098 RepID=UPI001C8BED98|nr:TetR/AcrR family transcriptional regulator [Actinotalea ferrariae]MBX9245182.1 TetR/AcrR family transcriptional regulator [Actinotalea ferrariae]
MRDPGRTRERILDAAEELFFRDGIAVTGVDAVAAEAGVAVVTLYKHVGSKDNLLREVLERRLRSWTEHWDVAVADAGSPRERLLAVFDAVETFRAAARPTQWCCFLATASERPVPRDGGDDPVLDLIEQDTRLVTERLGRLAEEAGCTDAATVAEVLLLLYNGVLSSLLRGAPADPVTHARATARAVVDASCRAAAPES